MQKNFHDFAHEFATEFEHHFDHELFDERDDEDDDGSHECAHHRLATPPRRTVVSPHKARKRDDINAARPFGGLRVLFDTRYVNDERACRAVGQNASDEAGGAIKVSAPNAQCTCAPFLTIARCVSVPTRMC